MEEVPHRTLLAPLVSPCFALRLVRVETEGLLDFQGTGGCSLPLYGGAFARSYSVSIRGGGTCESAPIRHLSDLIQLMRTSSFWCSVSLPRSHK